MFKICLILFSFQIFSAEKISVAISSSPNNIIPFYSTDANSQGINKLVHKSLVGFDDKMNVVCDLCLEYKITMNKNKEEIYFKLKPDLYFEDKTNLNSEIVKKSFSYFISDLNIKSSFMDSLENFEEIIPISKYEFKLVFKKYSSENVINLNAIKIIKFKNDNVDIENPENIMGLGKYKVVENTPLTIKLSSKENDSKSFEFKVVKDETTLALKLINNEIDLSTNSINARKINWLKNKYQKIETINVEGANYTYLAFNQSRELFKDLNVRKAISNLIPRNDLLKYQLMNSVTLSNGMFSGAFSKIHNNNSIDQFDPELSISLLKKAGYKLNSKNLMEKNGKVFTIDWKVSNNKSSIELVEILKNYFQKYGIIINYQIMEWGSFMRSFKAGNFDVVISQWVGFTSPDMLKFVFHSDSVPPKGGNRIRYFNKQFDKAIDLAVEDFNEESALKNYKLAYDIINNDLPYVSLWHPNIIWLFQSCLNGVKTDAFGSFKYLENITKEKCRGR